jgi:hypothetical protein
MRTLDEKRGGGPPTVCVCARERVGVRRSAREKIAARGAAHTLRAR